jgi:hypothetical protein
MKTPSSCKYPIRNKARNYAYDLATGPMFYMVMRMRSSVYGQMGAAGIWRIQAEIGNQVSEIVREEGE